MIDIRLLKTYIEVHRKEQLAGYSRAQCYNAAATLANAVPALIAALGEKEERIRELERGILYPYEVKNVSNTKVTVELPK